MITLEQIEKRHNYIFSDYFKRLWNDEMLNWMRGFDAPLSKGQTWAVDVYPTLKSHPPLLLHTGGSDFELLTPQEMLEFTFPSLWDTQTHHFIPFAKTSEGNIYAFYANREIAGENPVVLIWDDMDETEIIAKNFEDFIVRKMLEATDDIDQEDLQVDYPKTGIEGYRADILSDLSSISPYLQPHYREILERLYHAPVLETLFSYGFESHQKMSDMIKEVLNFDYLNDSFGHEA